MLIYTEMTPNPASLKFVVDRSLISGGAADYPNAAAAEGQSKFAEKIFKYPFVNGVFIGRNFVTVTKNAESRWEDVIPVVKDEIKRYAESGAKWVESEENLQTFDEGSELDRRIRTVIEEQVRPAVAMDGGDIVYEGYDDGVVKLRLRGSCSGCPSSMVTLKHGIENLLMRLFPEEVKQVEAV
jgi:Fe-S cluster biogenesis protein NfuA